MREDIQADWPQTWEEIFKGIPTAPGTEAEQLRHKQLREEKGDEMTEAEEQELNILFYIIYPQLRPKNRKEMESITMTQEQPEQVKLSYAELELLHTALNAYMPTATMPSPGLAQARSIYRPGMSSRQLAAELECSLQTARTLMNALTQLDASSDEPEGLTFRSHLLEKLIWYMREQQPGENLPTLEDIRTFAQQLKVTFTEAQNGEWFDLDRTETPQLMGTYRTTQSGIDNAYSDLRRLELTQQAITKHDQHKQ